MADAASTVSIKIATEGAEHFTDAYYSALQTSRHTLSTYYVPTTTDPTGKPIPGILWNGHSIRDGPSFQSYFESQMPYTHFEIQSLDAHVLNEKAVVPEPQGRGEKERNVSLVVVVNGSVRLEEKREGPLRGFSETMVLMPNFEREGKGRWRIMYQTFRYTV